MTGQAGTGQAGREGFETILYEERAGFAKITLNRPERLNAVTLQMLTELGTALERIEHNEAIRAVLLTGAGRGFCSGQDLNDRAVKADGARTDLGRSLKEGYNPLIRRLYALPKPTICAVNGTAAGAGANLALACDIVLAAEEARFIQAFSKLGLIPDSGGTFILPRLIGPARAKAITMLAIPVTGAQATAWGMIWKACPADELMAEAEKLAAEMAAQPTLGHALTKKALALSWRNDLEAQLDVEEDFQRQAGNSHDYAEGVAAFLEKRPPVYRGH